MSSPWWFAFVYVVCTFIQQITGTFKPSIRFHLPLPWRPVKIEQHPCLAATWSSWISMLSNFKSMKAYGLHKKPGLSTLQSYQGLCPPPQREFEWWVDAPGYFAQLNEDYRLPNEYPSLCENLQKIACCFLYHCTSRVKFLSLVKYEMV